MYAQSDRVGCLHPWHGWTVQTHAGDKVGFVKGQFDMGPHAGLLRVHRAWTDGIAVFAIPVSAVATSCWARINLVRRGQRCARCICRTSVAEKRAPWIGAHAQTQEMFNGTWRSGPARWRVAMGGGADSLVRLLLSRLW
jgi:hypothetical protein